MNKSFRLCLAVLGVATLASCSSVTKEKLGLAKKAPDEFMVVPRAPLSLPPEYDLRPVVEPVVPAVNDEGLSDAEKKFIEQVNKTE